MIRFKFTGSVLTISAALPSKAGLHPGAIGFYALCGVTGIKHELGNESQMKTLALFFAVLVNAAFLAVAVMAAATVEVPATGRAAAAAIALALSGALALLLLARLGKLPARGADAMRYLCLGVPVLWFAGSLDRGMISGQEWIFLSVVSVVTWGTWHVFKFLHSPA